MLIAIVGKERNGTSRGATPSCTRTHYAIYANYAKNAIYITNVRELTLVMVLVMAVGAVTLVTTAVGLRLRLTFFCLYVFLLVFLLAQYAEIAAEYAKNTQYAKHTCQ